MVEKFDLIVIGAGSGGLTAADFGIKLGAKVALVEKHRIGGDCTWTGCVPSKALLKVAKVAHSAKTAVSYGIHLSPPQVDMAQVHDYVHGVIDDIYQHETPEVLSESGIEVVMGGAEFIDSHTIKVGDRTLRGEKFVLATGAHPFVVPIPGLAEVPYHTYETLFDNKVLPNKLIVLGAGPVGVEMGQAYRRLGAEVTLVDVRLLPREEPEVAEVLGGVFAREGIEFVEGLATAVSYENDTFTVNISAQQVTGDMLLVAVGRRPNVAGLGLEKAGVVYSDKGINVDDKLQTSVPHIYAIGDCNGGAQFTHVAGWQGWIAVRNAFLPSNKAGRGEPVVSAFYTEPEVARIGMTEAEARQQDGAEVKVTRIEMDRVDRAVAEGDVDGFVKVVQGKNGRLLGATIVAARAGEMINEISVAMRNKLKVGEVATSMHAYPSYSMAIQQTMSAKASQDFLGGTAWKVLQRFVNVSES